jgi:hypothetical protein
MTNKEALKAWEKMYAEIDKENWLFVGTINPEMVDLAIKALEQSEERPQGEWVAIKYRPMTSEERKKFADHYGIEYCDTLEEKVFDCPMPEDKQSILISTSWGVDIDVADNDIDGEGFICYGLEGNGDWSGVNAWRPLPERYKEGGAE